MMASWRASQLDDVTLDSGMFSGTSSDKSSKKATKRGSIGQNLTLSISGGAKSSSGNLTNKEESLPTYKIILLGDSGVGKSNLIFRFTKNAFFVDLKPTIGVEFFSKTVQIDNNKLVKAQMWDTAGQERYQYIATSFYRNAVGAIIVYDVTNRKSFDHVSKWLKEVEENAHEDCVAMLVGNKFDLYSNHEGINKKRMVSVRDGKELAEKNGISYFETSALSGKGVSEAFHELIQHIFLKLEALERQRQVSQTSREEIENDRRFRLNERRRSLGGNSVLSMGQESTGRRFHRIRNCCNI